MSMTKEVLEYLLKLVEIETMEHDGLIYSNKMLHRIPEPSPKVFGTRSLASIVELINQEHDHQRLGNLIIHVDEPTEICVFSTLRDDLGRFQIYSAVAQLPDRKLGAYVDLEEMIIRLKSTFVQTETRDKLIHILGNTKEEAVKTSSDDGISQTVAAKTGIATVSNVTLPPIIKLAPYRTFVEVEQPEGEFLLRLQNGPRAALFEADGGA
ncbi:MAG: hypothetical protein AB1815_02730 [Bacillota bacterium]